MRLNLRQLGDVFTTAQQLDIRMTTDHTSGRAGRVEQNGVEQFTIPPGIWRGHIGTHNLGAELQAGEVFMHPWQAVLFNIQRYDTGVCTFQQMAGFTTGSSAGIENAFAVLRCQQHGGQLCGFVLHAEITIGKTGQGGDIAGFQQINTNGAVFGGMGFDTGLLQALKVLLTAAVALIYAQAQRWALVIFVENVLNLFGPGFAQHFHQPLRMAAGGDRVFTQRWRKAFVFAGVTAQAGINNGFGVTLAQLFADFNGGVYGGMRCFLLNLQLVQTDDQQGE